MPPPPAEPFVARIFLGPALRAQPDRRLVTLVREGYETAFEEIVRRYRKPLDRFAAAIVGSRSEDVTQDAFSKALSALRGTTTEIELRPWLYRIVRNTALNELRDGPPPTEELGEAIPAAPSAAVEAERREEISELMERLRALPEPQRAAIVMRELEGLSHEEIAAALGVSGGGARQAIYRARLALRDGLGLLIPLPLLRVLFDHGAEAAASAGGAAAAAGAASAAGGGGATLGGLGAAGALKVGVATAVLAGSVGAGVAIQHDRGGRGPEPAEATAAQLPVDDSSEVSSSGGSSDGPGPGLAPSGVSGQRRDDDRSGSSRKQERDEDPDDRGSDREDRGSRDDDDFDDRSRGDDSDPKSSSGQGRGHGRGGRSEPDDDSDDDAAESHSGRSGSRGHGGNPESRGGHGGSGSSGGDDAGDSDRPDSSGDEGHGGGSGSSGEAVPTAPPPASEPAIEEPGDDSGDGSESGGSDSDDDDDL
ncbi:MAG TPA: RNA polymerase sigma factor [Solirubrobacterales bacterium]|nr:RNA polymerase sigma factor [Solirubrobacterales bacterium]